YAAALAKKIDLQRTTEVPSHGTPPDAQRDFFKQQALLRLPGNGGAYGTDRSVASLSPQWGEGLRVRGGDDVDYYVSPFKVVSFVATTPHPGPLPVEGRGNSDGRPGFGGACVSVISPELTLNEEHTTHWSVADAEGNWVACTAT